MQEFKDLTKHLIKISDDIEAKKVRAGLVITNERINNLFEKLDNFMKFYMKNKQDSKICLIDLDIFENSLELEFPESLKLDNFLRIAFRKKAYNYVHRNDIQFAFYTPPANYIICEMHLIYLFERIFFEIISKFNPSLIVVLTNSNFTLNSRENNFILSGDCMFFEVKFNLTSY